MKANASHANEITGTTNLLFRKYWFMNCFHNINIQSVVFL